MIPRIILFTLLILLVYAAVQQNFRSGANDPQIQIAEDVGTLLEQGATPSSLQLASTIDIGKSLAPFIIIYDSTGSPVAGTGQLNGKTPTPPPGVLAAAKKTGENRITWQPAPRIREAIIVRYVPAPHEGYVLVGRSLREVEKREWNLMLMIKLTWLIGALIIVITSLINPKNYLARWIKL